MAQQMKHKKTSLETTDDGNEDNIQHANIYAKNSMDRFGDDMCALILSYLSLEDRFRLECVSKQFQRTVFSSVVFIDIYDQFDGKSKTCFTAIIELLAKKFPNIQTIDFREMFIECEEQITEVLRLFRDNCLNLREVYCFLEEETAQLYRQFGPLVTRIECTELSDTVVDTTSGQLLANNLETLKIYNYYAKDSQLLSAYVAHNQCLKCLDIGNFNDDLNATLPELAVQLSRLPQLRRLRLALDLMNDNNSVHNFLRTIGVNCKQLQRLSLRFCSDPLISNVKALDSLRYYCRLKRLHLTIYADIENMLEPLRHCKRLTHLKLDLQGMKAHVLKDLHQYCPRLHYLFIHDFNNTIDTECLSHISRLPALQTLVIGFENCGAETEELSDNDYSDLLSRSPKLKNITINGQNISTSYCR